MFTKEFLSGVRRLALRRKVWYSGLDRVERGILSIAARIIDDVRSSVLYNQLVTIIGKLNDASKSGFARYIERYGSERVRVFQVSAERIGYRLAADVGKDLCFVRYLVFLDYNQPAGWRLCGSMGR